MVSELGTPVDITDAVPAARAVGVADLDGLAKVDVQSITLTPALPSVTRTRLLRHVVLPQPVIDVEAVVALIPYQQQRKAAAYRSHCKHILRAFKL